MNKQKLSVVFSLVSLPFGSPQKSSSGPKWMQSEILVRNSSSDKHYYEQNLSQKQQNSVEQMGQIF